MGETTRVRSETKAVLSAMVDKAEEIIPDALARITELENRANKAEAEVRWLKKVIDAFCERQYS